MSDLLTNDLRMQYKKAFQTIRGIVEAFPEDRWRKPHGHDYYLPCRIAYHLAVVIGNNVANGFKDPDFSANLPYGRWTDATAEILPDKAGFLAYFDGAVSKAEQVLSVLTDDDMILPSETQRAWMGACQMGVHLYMMREISDHTGELNKMLIENGVPDVWIGR